MMMHSTYQPQKKQRKRASSATDSSEAIAVCVRIRPLVKHERGQSECIDYDGNEITVSASKKNYNFACTHIFHPSASQQTVFEQSGVRPLIESSLMGYNSTLFAYGPTGCGKTFSILGELTSKLHMNEGLIPRSIREVFNLAEAHDNRSIKLRVSCFEIYREIIHDLFVPSSDRTSLLCREHPKYGFFVDGLILKPCVEVNSTLIEVIGALQGRQTSGHLLNERSSRSHCMLGLHVDSLPKPDREGGPPTYGSMTFVDLAGSERPKETGSSGKVLRDAGFINKSLYMLGKVISGMVTSKGKRKNLVPYRDSALTKLLIGSLGGSSKTMMFGCISPASSAITETIRTLSFANQVKGIQNKPTIQLDPREKLIQELKNEIERLREENERLKDLFASTSPTSLRNRQLSLQMENPHDHHLYSQTSHQPVKQSLYSNTTLPVLSRAKKVTDVPSRLSTSTPPTTFPPVVKEPLVQKKHLTEQEKEEEAQQLELEEALTQQLFDQLNF